MTPLEAAFTIAVVALFVVAVLVAYVVSLARLVTLWRDAYCGAVERNDALLDRLTQAEARVYVMQRTD